MSRVPLLSEALRSGEVVESATSAWEIGLLSRAGRMCFVLDPKTWFQAGHVASWHSRRADHGRDRDRCFASSGELHGDPTDRLITVTARHLGAAALTRNRGMLDYAAAGHLDALPC